MSYRIIDQTESTSIVGTESIPGTQQTSSSETTPLNVRWTWNTALAWMITKFEASVSFLAWIVSSLIASSSFKSGLQDLGVMNKITTYTFTEADYLTFEPSQYEMVVFVNARFGTATSIKIGTLRDQEAYQPETSNPSCNVNIYSNSSNVSDRSINIALNGTGTITIISIKNV